MGVAQDHYVKCRDCQLCRSYGAALHRARKCMWEHQGRHPEHTVDLWVADKVAETYAARLVTAELPDTADDCPF
jgi:hypothetical protein